MIKFCRQCNTEHSNSDEFCSTLCFSLWLNQYTKDLIARIMDAIANPIMESDGHITVFRMKMEEEKEEKE